ncbi:hypothetical protein AKJ08_0490 [Vulgatibacter incomptus]|uniref:Uncharacterized protein n=1 Tax=Vulgatibacter incomptus TaxID=1391653 RepID=A0A0K1P990_9BACT|nr:hypothetical protein AKJ08_0490 [Vulgatibacter incomptus]
MPSPDGGRVEAKLGNGSPARQCPAAPPAAMRACVRKSGIESARKVAWPQRATPRPRVAR